MKYLIILLAYVLDKCMPATLEEHANLWYFYHVPVDFVSINEINNGLKLKKNYTVIINGIACSICLLTIILDPFP